jgi:hypothetical protein
MRIAYHDATTLPPDLFHYSCHGAGVKKLSQ